MKVSFEDGDLDLIAERIVSRITERLKSSVFPTQKEDDIVFSAETLARYLKTTNKWVYSHLSVIPHLKIDGLLRFKKTVIDKYFEKNPEKKPASP